MKILSFQYFSLFDSGGGSRILRRLYGDHETQIFSLSLNVNGGEKKKGNIDETFVKLIPQQKSWMRWKFRTIATWLREVFLKGLAFKKIRKAAANTSFDVLHVVDHGPYGQALCNKSFLSGRLLWLSFHDHFTTTGGSFENSKALWDLADRRLVISNELGNEYSRLFGHKDFEIITDGVYEAEISKPVINDNSPVVIYFAGLLHIDYLPLFKVLADALDLLSKEGTKIRLVLRGTQNIDFLNQRQFETEYRPVTNNFDELKKELDAAAILYLPIKFVTPDFYLYSLSTKMVGYLGGSGPILFHGPGDSAAGILLKDTGSAICCNTLEMNDMLDSLKAVMDKDCNVSVNAKVIAENQFNLEKIKQQFWQLTKH